MFCKNCGKEAKRGNKFCTDCGQEIKFGMFAVFREDSLKWLKKHRKDLLIILGTIIFIIIVGLIIKSQSNGIFKDNSNIINNARAVVNILCDDGSGGSGTIITSEGEILTNNHVIEDTTYCFVTIPDPETGFADKIYHAKPLVASKFSNEYDIAILNIDGSYTDSDGKIWGEYPTSFPAFVTPNSCSTSTPSRLGDSVLIYGYPVTSGGYNLTITDGIISSFADDGTILTSAKIDSGNSGGMAIDQNGCFIGIPSAVQSGDYQNLGVIIPPSIIKEFSDQISLSGAELTSPITSDQKCKNEYGINSIWSGEKNNDGGPTCSCQAGYFWDFTGNTCASRISLDKLCQNSHGLGSYSFTEDGKAACDCKSGYVWNSAGTACY